MQLSFLGPPLAALHSMTEMKSQNSPQTHGVNNPHGIDSILSRPTPVTSAQLNALTGGTFILDLVQIVQAAAFQNSTKTYFHSPYGSIKSKSQ